jgi:hypothetical protein
MPGGYLLIHDIFQDPAEGGQAPHEIYNEAISCDTFRKITLIKTLGVLKRNKNGSPLTPLSRFKALLSLMIPFCLTCNLH